MQESNIYVWEIRIIFAYRAEVYNVPYDVTRPQRIWKYIRHAESFIDTERTEARVGIGPVKLVYKIS